jgi:CHAD domain-containing protein
MGCDITLPDVPALANYVPHDHRVSSFDQRLQLGQAEMLGAGIKRVTLDQLELAASGYFDGEDQFAGAVHESRKAIKRIRALLRLVRPELTERVYAYEDNTMRDTGRLVSEVRSVVAVTEAAESVRDLYGELLADGTFDELTSRLAHRRDVVELAALEDPNLVGRVVRNLEKAYHRYSSWPTDPDAREVYGLGIRDDYSSIESGLHSIYARGRREMVAAYTTSGEQAFHQWRKRAKYLRYQMEFLAPLWPEVVVGLTMTLDHLGLLLGEDHDLAELLALLHARPDLCPNPRERSLFAALVSQRRTELQTAAEILGRRVYAEKPSSLQHRFGEYWESRSMALNALLDTLTVY